MLVHFNAHAGTRRPLNRSVSSSLRAPGVTIPGHASPGLQWREHIDWRKTHRPERKPLSRSCNTVVRALELCWFKPEATALLGNARGVAAIIDGPRFPLTMPSICALGLVVQDDHCRVAAVPRRK